MNIFSILTTSSKPKVPNAPFVVFQVIPLITLPIWFILFLFFDTGARPVSERNVSLAVYLLFGSQWLVPLFFFFGSAAMWVSVALRVKFLAWGSGIALCAPLVTVFVILMAQYIESVR